MNQNCKGIVMELIGLTNQMRRNADTVTARYGGQHFTGMQSFIIGFIARKTDEGTPVFQRDVEREFCISRSTVSGILSLMEKNRLICRESVPEDARLKRLVLTERAAEIHRGIHRDLHRMDENIAAALTPEETAELYRLLEKVGQVVGDYSDELKSDALHRSPRTEASDRETVKN